MTKFISIESDGTTGGTNVFDKDGKQLRGVEKIEIEPILLEKQMI